MTVSSKHLVGILIYVTYESWKKLHVYHTPVNPEAIFEKSNILHWNEKKVNSEIKWKLITYSVYSNFKLLLVPPIRFIAPDADFDYVSCKEIQNVHALDNFWH